MSSFSHIRLKEAGVPTAPDGLDGYTMVLPYVRPVMDAAAREIGVTPPSDFVHADRGEHEEMLDGELPEGLAGRLDRQREWHDPAEGLRTFRALLDHFRAREAELPDLMVGAKYDGEAMLITIGAIAGILEAARGSGDSFRIEDLL
jgi:hypothetical protein